MAAIGINGGDDTINAPQTIERIIDVYPADEQNQIRSMLANTLQAVISQTLFKRCDQPGMIPSRLYTGGLEVAGQGLAAMRRAMAEADVGDDVYGEDPTVNALQEAFAERVGKQAALFVPSGTMGNQLALRLLAEPGTSVIAWRAIW